MRKDVWIGFDLRSEAETMQMMVPPFNRALPSEDESSCDLLPPPRRYYKKQLFPQHAFLNTSPLTTDPGIISSYHAIPPFQLPHHYCAPAICVAIQAPNAVGFLVWIKTVPGPVNLHTRPSAEAIPESTPPLATRSIVYFEFQATRCSLSTMYCSPGAIYLSSVLRGMRGGGGRGTNIFLDNRAERCNEQHSLPEDLVDEQSLA